MESSLEKLSALSFPTSFPCCSLHLANQSLLHPVTRNISTLLFLLSISLFSGISIASATPNTLYKESSAITWQDTLRSTKPEEAMLFVEEGFVQEVAIDIWRDFLEEIAAAKAASGKTKRYNLNTISFEELHSTLGVSERQAQAFIDFRSRNRGKPLSPNRLKEVPGWDAKTIERIAPLFAPAPSSQRSWGKDLEGFRRSRVDASFTMSRPWGKPIDPKFLGEPYEMQLRARFSSEALSVGLLSDKDRFEPFFDKNISGFDRYGLFVMANNPLPVVKSLVLGDYILNFGQGLVARNSFMKGIIPLSQADPTDVGTLRPVLSSSAVPHFRGIATELGREHWQVILTYSRMRLDGAVDDESNTVSAVKYDPPHRTEKDIERRAAFAENSYLGRFAFRNTALSIGLNGMLVDWTGLKLASGFPGYSENPLAQGVSRTYNASLDATYTNPAGSFIWAGEAAVASGRKAAAVSSIVLKHPDYGRLFVAARYISSEYMARRGCSLSRWDPLGNEWGFFARYGALLSHGFEVNIYTDYYQSIKPRFRRVNPTQGLEGSITVSWQELPPLRLFATITGRRYFEEEGHLRILAGGEWKAQKELYLSVWGQYKQLTPPKIEGANGRGLMLTGMLRYQPSPILQTSLTVAYFDTDDFFTRQYLYAPRVLYSTSMKMRYGKGVDMELFLKTHFRDWSLQTSLSYIAKPFSLHDNAYIGMPSGFEGAITLAYRINFARAL